MVNCSWIATMSDILNGGRVEGFVTLTLPILQQQYENVSTDYKFSTSSVVRKADKCRK